MSAFQPDGLFLKRSGNGYKGKVLQYNSAAVVDAHVEHGYLVQSSIEDDLSRLGVQRLKEALKGKGATHKRKQRRFGRSHPGGVRGE